MLEQFAVVGVEDLVATEPHQVECQGPASHRLEKLQLGARRTAMFELFVFDRQRVLVQNNFFAGLSLLQLKTSCDKFLWCQVYMSVSRSIIENTRS